MWRLGFFVLFGVLLYQNWNKFCPNFDFEKYQKIKKENREQVVYLITQNAKTSSILKHTPSISPIRGTLTSSFGYRSSPFTGEKKFHYGIDLFAPVGTPILAPADGVVMFSGVKDGYGNFIMILHGNGIVTCYGHNKSNNVITGQKIRRGDLLGHVGNTGDSTGTHLHYEFWINGKAINPFTT